VSEVPFRAGRGKKVKGERKGGVIKRKGRGLRFSLGWGEVTKTPAPSQ